MYVRLRTHYTYNINKRTRQKSFMEGHWKIFILFKQKEGKIYIYINGHRQNIFACWEKLYTRKIVGFCAWVPVR
jgi:hypothetical protein